MAMLLLISSLVAAHLASGFEVPFPKDGAQIQSMIETGQTAIGAPAPGATLSPTPHHDAALDYLTPRGAARAL